MDKLRSLTLRLKALEDRQWTEDTVQDLLDAFVKEYEIGFGKIGQPVRMATTGGAPSPDLALVLSLLGKTETLARIDDVLSGASFAPTDE